MRMLFLWLFLFGNSCVLGLPQNTTVADLLSFFGLVPNFSSIFGIPTDGDLIIDTDVFNMTRDMYWNYLQIRGTGALQTNGFRVRTYTLDLSEAPTGSILTLTAVNGNNASGRSGAVRTAPVVNFRTAPIGRQGGATNILASNLAGLTATTNPNIICNGGRIGKNGAGGSGASLTTVYSGGQQVTPTAPIRIPINYFEDTMITSSGDPICSGIGGIFGSYGAGNGISGSGGAGGAGGDGGMGFWIAAETLIKPALPTTGVFKACSGSGGNGGNGENPPTSGTRTGGGGGGTAGGGSWVYIFTANVVGDPNTLGFTLSGGAGGSGGLGAGPGAQAGGGGASGGGGTLTFINVYSNSIMQTNGSDPVDGTPAVGNTPGVGAPINVHDFYI